MQPFYLIIAGSREFNDPQLMERRTKEFLNHIALEHVGREIVVISGAARGADSLGELFAGRKGYKVLQMPADWERYGRSAGYRRNEEMIEQADAAIYFWDGQSRGTEHCIKAARKKGIPHAVAVYSHGDLMSIHNVKSQGAPMAAHLSTDELCQGVLVACDGGSLNQQSKTNRYGYGTFRVFKDGDLRFSTYQGKELMTHIFDYGRGTASPEAECSTMLHALTYVDELIGRGYKDIVRIGADSQNALLAATTDIKKSAPHLRPIYAQIRELALKHRSQVQFVKIPEQDMKGLLGH